MMHIRQAAAYYRDQNGEICLIYGGAPLNIRKGDWDPISFVINPNAEEF